LEGERLGDKIVYLGEDRGLFLLIKSSTF